MKTKQHMRMEIKDISEEGTFEGVLSPYGNVDQGRDVVEAGAFTKTLKERGSIIPMLWQHDEAQPIGDLSLEDRPEGLYCKGRLLMELPEAQKAYLLMKERIVRGLSIGYEAIKDSVVSGVRHLKEIKLYEGSVVTFPMNEMALITSVKDGRAISRATGETLKNAISILAALIAEEAGEETTSTTEAAGEAKSEPDIDHSAVSSLLKEAKEAYQWNYSSN